MSASLSMAHPSVLFIVPSQNSRIRLITLQMCIALPTLSVEIRVLSRPCKQRRGGGEERAGLVNMEEQVASATHKESNLEAALPKGLNGRLVVRPRGPKVLEEGISGPVGDPKISHVRFGAGLHFDNLERAGERPGDVRPNLSAKKLTQEGGTWNRPGRYSRKTWFRT